MEEYNRDLLMSNLKLIKKINNDSSFREIIILKDGRLYSLDKDNIIKIDNDINFNTGIIIKNKEIISKGILHLESIIIIY